MSKSSPLSSCDGADHPVQRQFDALTRKDLETASSALANAGLVLQAEIGGPDHPP